LSLQIHSYIKGVSYAINKDLGNCSMFPIGGLQNGYDDGASMVSQYGTVLKIKTAEEIFFISDYSDFYSAGKVR
jgi:hypothetical protein